jgi:hypothetical protein
MQVRSSQRPTALQMHKQYSMIVGHDQSFERADGMIESDYQHIV